LEHRKISCVGPKNFGTILSVDRPSSRFRLRMSAKQDILNEMVGSAKSTDLSVYTEDSANAVRAALKMAEVPAGD
jgi:hypothetical protein